jgi:hypothetical protein
MVLLQLPNLVPVEYEVHLPQAALRSQPNRVLLCAKLDHVGVLDEGLPPDLNQCLFEGRVHCAF